MTPGMLAPVPEEPASTFELTLQNVSGYIRDYLGLQNTHVSVLPGGVSNTVLLVESERERLVIKQSLPRLRVEQEWLCDRSRIFRETAAMKVLADRVPAGTIPRVVYEDHESFIFAMTAAPAGAETWKTELLRGTLSEFPAAAAGELLSRVIRSTFENDSLREMFGDLTAFEQLRLDSYYRTTAKRHPQLADFFSALEQDCRTRTVSIVHGDFSPKNFLVGPRGVIAIDWECVHYGNPAFDAAFLLNHLLMKSFLLPDRLADFERLANVFHEKLLAGLPRLEWFETSVFAHLAGLLLARVDGKSPAEYLQGSDLKNKVRLLAVELAKVPATSIRELFERRALADRRST